MTLAVDARTSRATLWLLHGRRVVARRTVTLATADRLLPATARVLASHRVALPSLTGLIVVIGPGTFSLLRAAVASMKALAFALSLPLAVIRASGEETPLGLPDLLAARPVRAFGRLQPSYGQRPKITLKKGL